MKTNLFFLFFIFLVQTSYSQDRFDSLYCASEIDSLELNFGQNKEIIPPYRLSILKTLSYFPELKFTRIKFKKANLKTSLTTRPTFFSLLFRSKENRTYVVRIDESEDKIRIKDAPFNAKIGVFGHEFSHIVDYSQRTIWGVFGRGFAYLSNKKKANFEKHIDRLTIEHHLSTQLYDWAVFVLNSPNGTEEYKLFKREIYLEPEEIKGN